MLLAVRSRDQNGHVRLDAAQLGEKVQMKIFAAQLAIGDGVQTDIFLQLHHFSDGLVFGRAQLGGGNLPLHGLCVRVQQIFRAQEAADMIGAKQGFARGADGVSDGFSVHPGSLRLSGILPIVRQSLARAL